MHYFTRALYLPVSIEMICCRCWWFNCVPLKI